MKNVQLSTFFLELVVVAARYAFQDTGCCPERHLWAGFALQWEAVLWVLVFLSASSQRWLLFRKCLFISVLHVEVLDYCQKKASFGFFSSIAGIWLLICLFHVYILLMRISFCFLYSLLIFPFLCTCLIILKMKVHRSHI